MYHFLSNGRSRVSILADALARGAGADADEKRHAPADDLIRDQEQEGREDRHHNNHDRGNRGFPPIIP